VSTFSNDEPQVLRRRAKTLTDDGYNANFISVFLRAADELIVRRRCARDPEQETVNAQSDIRRLKRALSNIAGIIFRSNMGKEFRQAVAAELRIANEIAEPGKRRQILALAVGEGVTREEFLAAAAEQYDRHIGGEHGDEDVRASEGSESEAPGSSATQGEEQQAAEPSGAGHHANQPARAEEAGQGAAD
jgi:hypothetical protein